MQTTSAFTQNNQVFTLCMLENSHDFWFNIFFPQNLHFQKIISRIQSVFNSLDSGRQTVWPDLGQNCLQRVSADTISR